MCKHYIHFIMWMIYLQKSDDQTSHVRESRIYEFHVTFRDIFSLQETKDEQKPAKHNAVRTSVVKFVLSFILHSKPVYNLVQVTLDISTSQQKHKITRQDFVIHKITAEKLVYSIGKDLLTDQNSGSFLTLSEVVTSILLRQYGQSAQVRTQGSKQEK